MQKLLFIQKLFATEEVMFRVRELNRGGMRLCGKIWHTSTPQRRYVTGMFRRVMFIVISQ